MPLSEYQSDMETCCRCSACKFIPLEKVKDYKHVNVCPSISRYNFHAYSGGGRLGTGVALFNREIDYSDKLLEVVYNCLMCGACDISCKYAMDMEVLEPLNAIRRECVESHHSLAVLDKLVANLRKQGSLLPKAAPESANWFDGLKVKNYTESKTEIAYFAGCRTARNQANWKIAQSAVKLLLKAGIEVGIGGSQENCCGGRVFQMGYQADFLKAAKASMALLEQSGVKTLITGCAECYYSFKVLYERFNLRGKLEVWHTSQYFARLIQEGRLKPNRAVDLNVTYHDPCHLGRQGEPYIHWNGRQKPGQIRLFDPPKEFRRGTYGVYEPPREILKSLPGLKLTEMPRTKEYAWCCGAGGGVQESNPQFAGWTAAERIQEATGTGAEAIVTACPGCWGLFSTAAAKQAPDFKVYDVVELLADAVL